MNSTTGVTRLVFASSLGLAMTALPVRIADPVVGGLRVNNACGQATECYQHTMRICSTYHKDWVDYECSKGCGSEE
jgi:hypothetical protein